MKTIDKLRAEAKISDMIIKAFEAFDYNTITTSDLQAISETLARNIIEEIQQ